MHVSERHVLCCALEEMEIKIEQSRLIMLQHILRGDMSAWFPLLTASCFADFGTSVICHAMLILCLGSCLLQDTF